MKPKIYLSLFAAMLVAGAIAAMWPVMWQGWLSPPRASGADPADPVQVALGKRVYAANCASCHGAKLEGQPNWRSRKPDGSLRAPPHDASGHTWHHADFQLFEVTRNGRQDNPLPGFKSSMPAYKLVLKDDEIWAVLAFIKSSWPPKIRARQNSINARMKNPQER